MLALVAIAAAVGACGGDGDPAPAAPAPARRADPPEASASASRAPAVPPLCDRLRVRVVGRVGAPAGELSGLVRSSDGGFWAHNDSGDAPRILRLANDGAVRREVAVAGAEHVDWEDIAIRGRTLYIGDIGDNLRPASRDRRVPDARDEHGRREDHAPLSRRPARRRGAARGPARRHDRDRHQGLHRPGGRLRRPRIAPRGHAEGPGPDHRRRRLRRRPHRSSCAATTARTSGRGGRASRSPARSGASRASRPRTWPPRARARR